MRRRRAGLLGLAIALALLLPLTLAAHLMYVAWPWAGGARSVESFRNNVQAEWAHVSGLAPGRAGKVIEAVADGVYTATFDWTGLHYLVSTAASDQPLSGSGEAMRRFVLGLWAVFGTAYWSIQLIGLRLGVLAVAAPLFVLAAVGAAADGLVNWYLRRSGGGRESGFLYHRAKFALWASLFALWLVYLLPPVPMDPLQVLPAFVVVFGLAVRIAASYFKKYL